MAFKADISWICSQNWLRSWLKPGRPILSLLPPQATSITRFARSSVIDFYQGDYRKAIEELLLDADFLRDQLYTASCLISHGMGRGWRPRYERV
ncbi:hypothetical protein [Rhizobium sp. G21]|uniref:hypothetical protein n=1 Tax=Rhizobium sp. G21 TaxID=2758439 RepID=UPI001601C4D8|nr:hypothetical protein [Rhizobium sp. G21]MBB1251656.1 hypothetical protein [Rhizobium sp. G21]